MFGINKVDFCTNHLVFYQVLDLRRLMGRAISVSYCLPQTLNELVQEGALEGLSWASSPRKPAPSSPSQQANTQKLGLKNL